MAPQTIFQLLALFGLILTAIAGYGATYYGDRESEKKQHDLKMQIAKLESTINAKTDLIFQTLKVKEDVWVAVTTTTVPPTSAYLALLFKSDKGRISGKVRVQGSDRVSYFSTTANDTIPVTVANVWLPQEHKYKLPIVIEFTVTEKTIADASLSIFTQGWIDDLGQEPH